MQNDLSAQERQVEYMRSRGSQLAAQLDTLPGFHAAAISEDLTAVSQQYNRAKEQVKKK